MKLSDQYDHKALIKYGKWLLALTALIHFSKGYAAPIVAVMALSSLIRRKPIELMFFTMFLTLVGIGNAAIFSRSSVAVLTTRTTLVLITFLVIGKVFNSPKSRPMAPLFGIMGYICWEIVSSVQGYAPIVSLMKLFLFFCIFLSMYGIANEVNASTRANARVLRAAIMSIVALCTIGSVLLIPFPGISLMGKSTIAAQQAGEAVSLFCGIAAHSQAMGPLAAILGTFIFADLAFSIRKWDKFYLAMLICCPLVVYKTSSRTAMGTFIAGCGFVTLMILQSRGVGTRWKQRVMTATLSLTIGLGVAIVALPSLRSKAFNFILKSKDAGARDLKMENVMSSRQEKIELSKRGFLEKPILGNGFQVSAQMEDEKRSGIMGYLAAPIEKGVWIFAIPEEGGIVGMLFFCGWLAYLFPTLYRRKAYVLSSTIFAFVVANLGEFSIFSMTYVGGFNWILVMAAGVLDVARLKDQKVVPVFYVPIEQLQQEIGMDEWVRRRG